MGVAVWACTICLRWKTCSLSTIIYSTYSPRRTTPTSSALAWLPDSTAIMASKRASILGQSWWTCVSKWRKSPLQAPKWAHRSRWWEESLWNLSSASKRKANQALNQGTELWAPCSKKGEEWWVEDPTGEPHSSSPKFSGVHWTLVARFSMTGLLWRSTIPSTATNFSNAPMKAAARDFWIMPSSNVICLCILAKSPINVTSATRGFL